MPRAVARYREFAPCDALRAHVAAVFAFTPPDEDESARSAVTREVVFGEGESFCSPFFADGHASIVFSLGRTCCPNGVWRPGPGPPRGVLIGPSRVAGPAPVAELPAMLGAYFRAAAAPLFTRVPAFETASRILALEDLWRPGTSSLAADLADTNLEADRIGFLERALLRTRRMKREAGTLLDVPGLAQWVLRCRGRLTVEHLARAAGVSRQHLTRLFHEVVGVTPKLYCRLARFQAGLAHAGRGRGVEWAQIAAESGYADQSHMIAEFREFSTLTPETLALGRWFHPFIERARARLTAMRG